MPEKRKGKTYEEFYGEERAREIRRKQSISNRGSGNGMFGKHHSLETRLRLREKALGRPSGNKGKHLSKKKRQEQSERMKAYYKEHPRSLELRLKQSNSVKGPKNHFYGKHHTQEALRKNADAHKGDKSSMRRPEVAKKHGDKLRGRSRPKEVRIKIGLAKMGEKNPMKRPEVRRKVSIKQKENYKSSEARQRIREAVWTSPLFQDWYHYRYRGPNKTEAKLESLLNKYNMPFKFVGDGQLIIGGMCPDYANYNGAKQLIELYGDYWHKGDNPQNRIDVFKKYGYDCLVIWEHELKDESKVLNRVRNYFNLE